MVQCVVSGSLSATNTHSFGNERNTRRAELEVRAVVTLIVPLGGPVGQAFGLDAAVCQCLRNASASA